jgi:hypothetical protein
MARLPKKRSVQSTTIKNGDWIMITHVEKSYTADLGKGAMQLSKLGNHTLIVIRQDNGSELRMLIGRD